MGRGRRTGTGGPTTTKGGGGGGGHAAAQTDGETIALRWRREGERGRRERATWTDCLSAYRSFGRHHHAAGGAVAAEEGGGQVGAAGNQRGLGAMPPEEQVSACVRSANQPGLPKGAERGWDDHTRD